LVGVDLRTHHRYKIDVFRSNLGQDRSGSWPVLHLEPNPCVDLGAVVLVRLPQQAEESAERFDDRGDPLLAHPFGWRLGEAEPSLRRLLDRGGLADPAGHECRVSSGIEGAPVAGNFGVAVVDRLP